MSVSAHPHCTEGRPRKSTVPLSWITRGRVLTARAGRAGTREKREPVVKVVQRSPSSESGDDGRPTLRRLSKDYATRMKWPSLYRGGAEEALEDGKHVLELSGRSTKVRVGTTWNIIIEKMKTAGAETCPTHGGPGGSKPENQLHLTAGDHETTSPSLTPLFAAREPCEFDRKSERWEGRVGFGDDLTRPDPVAVCTWKGPAMPIAVTTPASI
ncbi:hypothetical protein B0H14DRAFT_2601348 [Mycena olivaceomarginata]|nr:hypothetical protein B0H14DRAFT_2601348 [Mycena olivaceomarginata]